MKPMEILAFILITIDVVAILLFFLIIWAKKLHRRNNLIVARIDEYESVKQQRFIITLYNAYKFNSVWGVNLANLSFYLSDHKLDGATFEKHPTISGAFRLKLPSELDHETSFKIAISMRANSFNISPDNGQHLVKVITIPSKEISKIKERVENGDKSEALKQSLFEDYKNSDKQFRFNYADLIDFKKGTHVHLNESQSTTTTIRYQHLIPDEYLKTIDFEPEKVGIYHVFEGHLYKFEMVYLGRQGDLYEWDLINLQPNTAYVGISLNSAHNPLIRPSKAFYGITKSEDGSAPNLDGSQIAKPNENMKKFKMWTKEIAEEAIGESLTNLQYKIIAKKHHEYHNEDSFIFVDRADQIFNEFPWLENVKELDEE